MRSREWTARAGLAALALALAFGCGEGERAAEFEEARKRVNDAQERLDAARTELEEREEALETARDRVQAARERVDESESELAEAREEVASYANDTLVFRSVQKRLLEDQALEAVAVRAAVEGGVVTLSGRVPSRDLQERAVRIAEETAGVVDVVSRIEVADASGEDD